MVTTGEALEVISGGRAIYTPEFAQRVCDALGVEWDAELVQVYETDILPLGVRMKHGPADGVLSLELARYIAEQLGVQDKAQRFLGRGSQAREYARVVTEALGVKASG